MKITTLLAFVQLALPVSAAQDSSDWPHWRGPDRTGVSPETEWRSEGAEEPLWVADVGLGYSSPSIANGRLYTRGFFEADGLDVTFCLDAETGAELWSHVAPAELWDNMHRGGTLSTPTVDGDTVYVLSRMGPLFALDAEDGDVRWERPLAEELEVELGPFGLCSSPVVLGDVLIVNVGKTIAMEKATGKTIWTTKDYGAAYATPAPFALGGKELLAVFNGSGLCVLEQATGEEVALYEWTSEYNVNSATPIVVGNRIFISTGYNEKGCALLELGAEGLEEVWASKHMSNKMNGCVLVGELLYGFDNAELKCLDLGGNVRWNERGLGKGTVIAAGERLIVLSEEGELLIAPATGEGFEPTYRQRVLEEGVCWTTPVLAGGRIFCRSNLGTLVARDHRARE